MSNLTAPLKKLIGYPRRPIDRRQVELVISGRVQGVNYRATIVRWCRDRALTGYIINRSDKTVYVLAQGTNSALESLIQKCYAGPESAQVQSVNVKYSSLATDYSTFSIKH